MSEKLIDVNSVCIDSNRVRKARKPEKLKEMRESLETVGIIQPVVLKFKENQAWVVAGETRLLLVREMAKDKKPLKFLGRELSLGLIPFVETEDLTEDELLDIELRENIDRADLTWQEMVEGRKRLYELRIRQGKTLEDVAQECGDTNPSRVADTIEFAARLSDPDIAKAKTLDEAKKIAAKKDESIFLQALARKVQKNTNGDLQVVETEALDYTRKCESGIFDIILTDPPYGINADSFGVGMAHLYDDSPKAYRKLMEDLVPELFRVLKERSHMYLFCDIEHFLWLRELTERCGFNAWRTPMIWKKDRGHIPISTLGPMRTYEFILFANKGNRLVEVQNRPDVIEAKIVGEKIHAAQKPVELYTELLSRSAKIGDTAFDPFCGSGTIFAAAHVAKIRAVGVDLDTTRATLRVQELLSVPQMELEL